MMLRKTHIPFMRAPSSSLQCIPKAPSPNTFTLGIRFQHTIIGRGTNIKFIIDIKGLRNEEFDQIFAKPT